MSQVKQKDKKVSITFMSDEDTDKALRKKAAEERISRSDVIRRAIKLLLSKNCN